MQFIPGCLRASTGKISLPLWLAIVERVVTVDLLDGPHHADEFDRERIRVHSAMSKVVALSCCAGPDTPDQGGAGLPPLGALFGSG
jgi:hypothetical protein